ncbi:MAG: asparagine synthase (glutamine-hydrolyzing), partial [Actinobacteria bacterium]|nr:asparagine synthase (glutamine-hydrolyzing) [Actinomycetota bacterium]
PDDAGFYEDDYIAMGFRRLSIIDLDTGHQPIFNETGQLVLTFNGEIYNYREIREELVGCGHIFGTKADSEVLLHGFEEWGVEILGRLRGMFAFAIYNKADKSLFIARDPFGIKPMHYMRTASNFLYGSEIKSFLEFPGFDKRFNYRALDRYLSFQYSVPPETFFEGVFCLLPGHYLWYKEGEVETKRYWEARFNPDETLTEDEAVDRIDAAFEDSVEAHRIADVEVGCFLSSGVDSSYVASYFEGQRTFTVGFDFGEKYNETSYAERLSKEIHTTHYSKIITSDEFWDAVPIVQYHLDQPLADPSAVALYFVSKLASEHVKVVLSGEGADELFGGYTIYREPSARRRYQRLVPYSIRNWVANFARKNLPDIKGKAFLIRGARPIIDTYIGNAFMFDVTEKRRLLKDGSLATSPKDACKPYYERVPEYDSETQMQYLDINLWMVGDILLKADRMSMANSLELRVPFLDRKVFEVASSLPTDLRVNKENTKYAMRKAASRHLPLATAEKRKLGFPVPTRVWLRDEKYYLRVKEAFTSENAEEFFDTAVLVEFLDEHYRGDHDNSRKIWTVYSFLVWYSIYFAT